MIRILKLAIERALTWLGTIFLTVGICCFISLSAAAQTAECPSDKVCITPDAARKALADADAVEQQKREIAVKDAAIADLKKLLDDMRIEFARLSGENSALRQTAISDRAIMDILLKHARKRCAPLSICF